MPKCPKCDGDSKVLGSCKSYALSECLLCGHTWTWANPDLEDPRRSMEEVEAKIAMFFRAKREAEMTEQQKENCDSAIQILRWFIGGPEK